AILRAGTLPQWVGILLIAAVFVSFGVGGLPAPLNVLGDDCMHVALIAIGWRVAVSARHVFGTPRTTDHDARKPNAALAGASFDG
ncbi:MAG: hypothetical protein ACRDPA_02805, partial [Solirubrobacteraceae bacterium]